MNSRGSTLIIGLLILSAVISTSILIGGIVFRELGVAFSISKSQNAYYAAESGSEMVLYQWVKNGSVKFDKGYLKDVDTVWGVKYQNSAINLSGDLGQHQTKEIPLYNVVDDEPLDGLHEATVYWGGGGRMEYSLFSWNDDEQISFFTKGGEISRGVMNATSCVSSGEYDCQISFKNLDDTKKYVVRFRPMCDFSYGLCGNSWIYSFEALDTFGDQIELPIGFIATSTGESSSEYRRKIESILPLRGETFGIFDYGIFSDEALKLN